MRDIFARPREPDISFLKRFLSTDEELLESIDVHADISFVPYGQPDKDYNPGELPFQNEAIVSLLGVYGLSERLFEPDESKPWPYQAVLILPGGPNLVIQTKTPDVESAKRASAFLTKVLFTLGKRESDLAALAAANDYQRQQEERNR